MDLKKIGRIITRSGGMQYGEADGAQWAGDGSALYRIDGIPRCEIPEQLMRILGVDERRINAIDDKRITAIKRSDGDMQALVEVMYDADLPLMGSGVMLMGSQTSGEIYVSDKTAMAIDPDLLRPFGREEEVEVYRGTLNGHGCMVAKVGMVPIAMIMPMVFSNEAIGVACKTLEKLGAGGASQKTVAARGAIDEDEARLMACETCRWNDAPPADNPAICEACGEERRNHEDAGIGGGKIGQA